MSEPVVTARPSAPPDVVPEPDWTALDPFRPYLQDETHQSFVSPGPTGGRLRVSYFRGPDPAKLVGRAWFGPETEGPPGHAHGGSVAAVMDEALGAVAYTHGYPVVVARLTVDFRSMVPVGIDATFETWIERMDGRKVYTRGSLLAPDGTLLADGHAICVKLGEHHIETFKAVRHARRARPRHS
jgi:acyl-coenzyme A thioesterase PaaI-like protein